MQSDKSDALIDRIFRTELPQTLIVPEAKRTQCEIVLDHLKTYGSITSLEAAYKYQIVSLPKRICELAEVVQIKKLRVRTGTNKHYIRYSL